MTRPPADQLPLGLITAHCFWAACPHTVEHTTTAAAHNLMEAHYTADHARDLHQAGYR